MTQSSPTVLLYAQAATLLTGIQDSISAGMLRNVNDITARIQSVLASFEASAGRPVMKLEKWSFGETPRSAKLNRMMQLAGQDVTMLRQQYDILRAATVETFNITQIGLERQRNESARLSNKLKTLQLYSNNVDPTIVVFSDNFASDTFMDAKFQTGSPYPQVVNQQVLTLPQEGELENVSMRANITITDKSNGYAGNNQEVDLTVADPSGDPAFPLFTFMARDDGSGRSGRLNAILDNSPLTWFEYEKYGINYNTLANTWKGWNYHYINDLDGSNSKVRWAVTFDVFRTDNVPQQLDLNIQIDLGSLQQANRVTYTPFALRGASVARPVKIHSVNISQDAVTWVNVAPTKGVWIGTDINLSSAQTIADFKLQGNSGRDAEMVVNGVWNFESQMIRYISFNITQYFWYPTVIGHLWFSARGDTSDKRIEGPYPYVSNPVKYLDPRNLIDAYEMVNGNYTSRRVAVHREKVLGARWAIGIRDITVERVHYLPTASMVTNTLRLDGVVDRVSLDASYEIPDSWDKSQQWIKFYVSPDNGQSWFQIARIQDDFNNVPEILAFNDPIPTEFRESGVGYYNVPGTVNQLRFRVDFERPNDDILSTPVLHSYRLKVKRR